ETVLGGKVRVGKAVVRAEMAGDLKVEIDINSMAFKMVDKVVPAVQLPAGQGLRITGEVSRAPDTRRRSMVIHVVKADHIHTELGEAGGDFFRPVFGGEVGPEGVIHPPELGPAPGFTEVEMAVVPGVDMTPAVN